MKHRFFQILILLSAAGAGATAQPAGGQAPAAAPAATPSLAPSSLALPRGGQDLPTLHVHQVTIDGVLASESEEPPRWVAWDRVQSVSGPASEAAAAFAALADDLWRARTRLERGDIAGAEPLFELHQQTLAGRTGPTPAIEAAGAMRCALWRGAWATAVRPMLAYSHAISQGTNDWWPRPPFKRDEIREIDLGDPLFFDDAMGLSPAIPPIFLNVPATRVLANEDWTNAAPAGSRAEKLATLYRVAATQEGQPDTPANLLPRPNDDDGLALVWDIVTSRSGSAADRGVARARLRERASRPGPLWQEIWCKVALGRSLVRESERDQKLLGVAQLLEPQARYPREHPYLTGLAMAEACVQLAALGDGEGAARIKAELVESFPSHPALGWDAVLRVSAAAPTPRTDQGGLP